jgi:sulfite reductase (ferredoxin)
MAQILSPLGSLADLAEIGRYEESVRAFFDASLDGERFTAIRLQHGVYGQRQEGVNMLRIKVPGGRLDPHKLEAIADVLEGFAQSGAAHITTRQDIQIHFIPLAHTAEAMKRLAQAGLTTREACGNTIRNVTACPLAGVCPREHTDVTVHLGAAVRHFLRNPLNQQLPRKFKVSFSGCEADCAQGLMHDLGVVAVHQDGRFGFRVLAGGGLGHKPREAIVVEPFIEEADLLPAMEAIVALHNRYSDRTKRAKSRIKFLVERFGAEGFIEKYREEFERARAAHAGRQPTEGVWQAGANSEIPGPGAPRGLFAQKQTGQSVVPVAVPLGQLDASQLRGLAALTMAHGLRDVRTTQDQNLMILGVASDRVPALRAGLGALGLGEPRPGDNVVACPGTSTCRLGITSSTVVAPKLDGGAEDLRVRVSGCHNGCAQPETGDIGIFGEGRRMHGRLIPHYQMYFGGNGLAGGGLAIKGPSVPSARVETAIARVKQAFRTERVNGETFFGWARRQGSAYFGSLLADLLEVKEAEVLSVARDHGDTRDFRVLQLGGGECAGATQVQIGAAFFDAAHERDYRDAFVFQRKYADAARCAEAIARGLGQGLVQLVAGRRVDGVIPAVEALRAAGERSLADGLAAIAEGLAESAEDMGEARLAELFRELDAWTLEAAQVSGRRDPQLDVGEALPRIREAILPVPAAQRREPVALSA